VRPAHGALALDPTARALIAAPNVAHVVTRRGGGRVRVVVTWVAHDGARILLNSRADRHWLRDVRSDPHVVVTVVDLVDQHRYVTVEGRVASETGGHQAEHAYRRLAEAYWGGEAAARHLPTGERVELAVTPDRVRVYAAVKPPAA